MVVTCDSCKTMTNVGRDALLAGVAECEQCGKLLEIAEASDAPSAMRDEEAPPRTPIPPPPEITVDQRDDGTGYRGARTEGITIRRTRRGRSRAPMVFRMVLLVAVLVAWIVEAVVLEGTLLSILLVPISAAVSLNAWSHLARYRNTTTIEADAERITVTHGPLPSPLVDRQVPRDDLRQLYAYTPGKHDPSLGPYQVRALRAGDVTVLLVEGLDTRQEAMFIEQQLESALGIPDREVAGELPRKRGRGVPKGYFLTYADATTGLWPPVRRALAVTAPFAASAASVLLYHHPETLVRVELGDEPQTVSFEVAPSLPDVYLAPDVDVDIGDLRPEPELPAFDVVVKLKREGSDELHELICEVTRRDDTLYSAPRVNNERQQHVAWMKRLDHCPLKLAPGRWTMTIERRWRVPLRETDRVVDDVLMVKAKR